MLKGPDRDKVVVLDVRDDDEYCDGHILGAVNVPAYTFSNDKVVDMFIKSRLSSGCEMVVVHCYLSQQRGPMVARRLAARLAELGRRGSPEVVVLANGWRRFSVQFSDDDEVVEFPDGPLLTGMRMH